MALLKGVSPIRYISLLPLPSLYVLLVGFTMIQSTRIAGGTYYRILGLNPIAAAVGMFSDGLLFYGVLLIFGTLWWFYIGYIGRRSWEGSVSRLGSAFGGFVSLFSAALGVGMTDVTFRGDDSALQVGPLTQYAGVGMLCLGAIVVTIYSTIAVFRRNKTFASRSI